MGFGKKFKSSSTGFGKRSRKEGNKYNNTKIERHGLTFDSLLELYVYEKMVKYGVKFNFQHRLMIQDSYVNRAGKRVRSIKWFVDFVVPTGDKVWYVDAKGEMTAAAKIKEKLADKILFDSGIDYEIKFVTGDIGKPKTLVPIGNLCVYLSKLQKEHGTGSFEFKSANRQSKQESEDED